MRHTICFYAGLFFVTWIVLGAQQAYAQGSVESDREALIAFYDSTNGDNWHDTTNWKSDKPLGEWYGISTNEEGRVESIDFHGDNGLTGFIPSKIGDLKKLRKIHLPFNKITGFIPFEIKNLTELEILNIDNNKLIGIIPPGIVKLVNLKEIHLSLNNINGSIPSEIGNLVNLEEIHFFGNKLNGSIPPEIGNLVNLKNMIFSGNELNGTIPSTIGNLKNVKNIALTNNFFQGSIPSEIGNLKNLTHLYLSVNELTGYIPPEIGNLINIKVLNVHSNQLMGSIPSEIGNLVKLKIFNIRSNQLVGEIPPEVCDILLLPGIYARLGENPGLINNCSYIPEQFANNRKKIFAINQNYDPLVIKPVEFVLIQENEYARLWISDEIFQTINISDESMKKLLTYLFSSIPADSTKGVFEYANDLLGTVRKNYAHQNNGERIIDILCHIYDWNYWGFAGAYDAEINIYSYNGLPFGPGHEVFSRVIAHEYVHNIHLAYEVYSEELDFFLEVIAEWASENIMFDKGNMLRSYPYYENPYPGKPLFPAHPFDYDEAELFGVYLGERVGVANMKHLIQICKPGGICDPDNPEGGDWYQSIDGLDYALSLLTPSLTLSDIVKDYHATNFINNPTVFLDNVKYGYETPRYANQMVNLYYDTVINIEENVFFQTKNHIFPGGYTYTIYENPYNLHLSMDKSHNDITSLRLFKEKNDIKKLVEIPDDLNEYIVNGKYDRVTLIAIHTNPRPDQPEITIDVSATQNYDITAIEDDELPVTLALEKNYPNPFNPSTFIRWAQPQTGQVRLSVYNMLGQQVATLVDEVRSAGVHEIRLDALGWTSGVYVYALEANGRRLTETMILLK